MSSIALGKFLEFGGTDDFTNVRVGFENVQKFLESMFPEQWGDEVDTDFMKMGENFIFDCPEIYAPIGNDRRHSRMSKVPKNERLNRDFLDLHSTRSKSQNCDLRGKFVG